MASGTTGEGDEMAPGVPCTASSGICAVRSGKSGGEWPHYCGRFVDIEVSLIEGSGQDRVRNIAAKCGTHLCDECGEPF